MRTINRLEDLNVKGKTVLVRVDLNVPMHAGRIEDATRINELVPTFEWLIKHQAKIVVISHFGRPNGEFKRELSLAPLANALSVALKNIEVKFAIDCIGKDVKNKISEMQEGEIILLENLRFHKGEEANDPEFIANLAELADIYVNDTFSCSHRKHASIYGIAEKLPSAAGKLLQKEILNIEKVLLSSDKPMVVITGGSKVSTKLSLLHNLVTKADYLVIGGAMANSFLKAKGHKIGKSLYEPDLIDSAKEIIVKAKANSCELILPKQVVVAKQLVNKAKTKIIDIDYISDDEMILDIGPESVTEISDVLKKAKTVVWNGPLGAFEYRPFDVGTISVAREVSILTDKNKIISLAGGGDIVSAISLAGLTDRFTYISTAGGAFLEWLEGKELPGIGVLNK